MRYGGLGQNGATTEQEPRPAAAGAPALVKEIPYDYVATFKLTGIAGTRVQDVISVSTEGTFVAVAIGYSFTPKAPAGVPVFFVSGGATAVKVTLPTALTGAKDLEGLSLGLFQGLPAASFTGGPPSSKPESPADLLARTLVLARFRELCGLDFKYSLVDSGSGRELQNQPIHNIAGLGRADGDRPFRQFARPALFMPRSTIRIEVEEISEGALYADGLLYIVLQGYKRLGE